MRLNMLSNTAIALTPEDHLHLELAISRALSFPPALLERAALPLSFLTERLDQSVLDRRGILTAAYYGVYLLPANYQHWMDAIDRVYRVHSKDSPLEDEHGNALNLHPKKDKKEIQDIAARQFGFNDRRELEAFYSDLDKLAATGRFGSYENLVYAGRYIADVVPARNQPIPPWYSFTEEEEATYSNGPAFLWDMAMMAKSGMFPEVAFGVHAGWVLYAHRMGPSVQIAAFYPPDLRRGAFERPGEKNPSRGDFMEPGDLKLLADHEHVAHALEQLASERFPDCKMELIPEPLHIGVKLVAA
jgi:hypothetical protein